MSTPVAGAIIVHRGKILIGQRKETDSVPLKWEFPGGKIEEGETPQECLQREIWEELSLKVRVGDYFGRSVYAYDHGTIDLVLYWAYCEGTPLPKPRAHRAIRWVAIEELGEYPWAPADVPLVKELQRLEFPP
ncbi:MAG: (deoxy)nucleoside triphosphate pyrophosphohydrolase [Limnochordia bacterium]|jgi:8-oxo-dGTP diphosphatase